MLPAAKSVWKQYEVKRRVEGLLYGLWSGRVDGPIPCP